METLSAGNMCDFCVTDPIYRDAINIGFSQLHLKLLFSKLRAIQPTEFLLSYGTAGFRGVGKQLNEVAFLCGIGCVLYSFGKILQSEAVDRSVTYHYPCVGVMVTASHNPPEDNGLKLIEHDGSLFNEVDEARFLKFIRSVQKNDKTSVSSDGERWERFLNSIVCFCKSYSINLQNFNNKMVRIFIGWDLRASSLEICSSFTEGVRIFSAEPCHAGPLTTPQFQFIVSTIQNCDDCNIEGYFDHFECKFKDFITLLENSGLLANPCHYEILYFDGSCSIGGLMMKRFADCLKSYLNINVVVKNLPSDGILNDHCGSEYIQNSLQPPRNFAVTSTGGSLSIRGCSIDGDADRLVYFHIKKSKEKVTVLNGDKVAALFGLTLVRFLNSCIVECVSKGLSEPLRFGIVHTAYSNSSFTNYVNFLVSELLLDKEAPGGEEGYVTSNAGLILCCVVSVRTGVKNLQSKAKHFDICVYSEPNGHCNVVFHNESVVLWATRNNIQCRRSFKLLLGFLKLFNQTTGDALTNVLAVEAALSVNNMDFEKWSYLYDEKPFINLKVHLPRSLLDTIITDSENGSRIIAPSFMQREMDTIVQVESASNNTFLRAFARPSGTENVCRIYVEGDSEDVASRVAQRISELFRTFQ